LRVECDHACGDWFHSRDWFLDVLSIGEWEGERNYCWFGEECIGG
jgi:hypothetical protein